MAGKTQPTVTAARNSAAISCSSLAMERLLFLWDDLDDLVSMLRHWGRRLK